jgi:hypothetical protein
MSLTLKADKKRIVMTGLISCTGILFGFSIYSSIPVEYDVRYIFLIVPAFVSPLAFWSVLRRSIHISAEGVLIIHSFSEDWIPISELAGWKIKTNDRGPSLHLVTGSGRKVDIFRIGMLGVSNVGATSARIANELSKSGKSFKNFGEQK